MSKYLVTGGGGFIGSHLAETLSARGESVVILDDFSSGKKENIVHFSANVEVVEGSITDLEICRKAVSGADYVLHHAALASVPRSIEDPVASNDTNVNGTLNMLVASRDEHVKRFVFASSSAVYGDHPELPKRETSPCEPITPYAVQKFTGEHYARVFFELFGLETVMLRYFNVFGTRQDPNSAYAAVIPKFVTALLRGESPVIYGDGEQTRDFTHIDNVVSGNLLACGAPSRVAGQTYNCARGESATLNELAGILQELTGSSAEIVYEDARPGDIVHSLSDISRASQTFGYVPEVSLREGLSKVVEWYAMQA